MNAAVMWGSFALIAAGMFVAHLPLRWIARRRDRSAR